jgi:hypothetical protein
VRRFRCQAENARLGCWSREPDSWSSPRGPGVEGSGQSDSSGSSDVLKYSFMTRWVGGMPFLGTGASLKGARAKLSSLWRCI